MIGFNEHKGKLSSSNDNSDVMNHFMTEVKDELNQYLVDINENTTEIQGNFEFLCDINGKIDKLCERMEKIELFLGKTVGFEVETTKEFTPKVLTKKEQEIFLYLYTLEEKKGTVTYKDIARAAGLPEDLVSSYMTNLIEKNIPIVKHYANGIPTFRLDKRFKQQQAKKNILGLEQRTIPMV